MINSIVFPSSKGLSKVKRWKKLKPLEAESPSLQQSIAVYYGEQQNLFGLLTVSQISGTLSNYHSISGHFDSVSLMWRQQGAGLCLNSSPHGEKDFPTEKINTSQLLCLSSKRSVGTALLLPLGSTLQPSLLINLSYRVAK